MLNRILIKINSEKRINFPKKAIPKIAYKTATGNTLSLAIKQKLLNYIVQKFKLLAKKVISLILRFTEFYNFFGVLYNIRLIAKKSIILIRLIELIKLGAGKIFTGAGPISAEVPAKVRGIFRNS